VAQKKCIWRFHDYAVMAVTASGHDLGRAGAGN
jgi:hypothetical protein